MLLHYLVKCKCPNYTVYRIKALTKTYSVIDEAIDEWRKHLRACIQAKEGHSEHLI